VEFTIVQACPQCGGPVELNETDRLLRCPYCEVNSFLFSDTCCRFVLPCKGDRRDLIYAPYLRFKGSVFTCDLDGVHYRILDITQLGIPFKRFPISLGLKPQAMKMRFAGADGAGSFLKCILKTRDILARAEKRSVSSSGEAVFHRAFIGDAISLIYLPIYVNEGTLFDGITNHPIARMPVGGDIFATLMEQHPHWKLTFLATLCPRCGWDLTGERDSVVLTCRNCETAWEAKNGGFAPVTVNTVPSDQRGATYLPFWKMSVRTTGIPIASYADFIRATNQPRVIQEAWEDQDMVFWCPAFKIRPNRFLYLSRRLTVSQEALTSKPGLPRNHLYPVTLPLSEAIQAIKLILGGSAVNKRKLMPHLPSAGISIKDASLAYLPFRQTVHEMIQEQTEVSINRNTLIWGRFL
jgi:uncharacterized protein YbaR (Trm112 family)